MNPEDEDSFTGKVKVETDDTNSSITEKIQNTSPCLKSKVSVNTCILNIQDMSNGSFENTPTHSGTGNLGLPVDQSPLFISNDTSACYIEDQEVPQARQQNEVLNSSVNVSSFVPSDVDNSAAFSGGTPFIQLNERHETNSVSNTFLEGHDGSLNQMVPEPDLNDHPTSTPQNRVQSESLAHISFGERISPGICDGGAISNVVDPEQQVLSHRESISAFQTYARPENEAGNNTKNLISKINTNITQDPVTPKKQDVEPQNVNFTGTPKRVPVYVLTPLSSASPNISNQQPCSEPLIQTSPAAIGISTNLMQKFDTQDESQEDLDQSEEFVIHKPVKSPFAKDKQNLSFMFSPKYAEVVQEVSGTNEMAASGNRSLDVESHILQQQTPKLDLNEITTEGSDDSEDKENVKPVHYLHDNLGRFPLCDSKTVFVS